MIKQILIVHRQRKAWDPLEQGPRFTIPNDRSKPKLVFSGFENRARVAAGVPIRFLQKTPLAARFGGPQCHREASLRRRGKDWLSVEVRVVQPVAIVLGNGHSTD